MKKKLDSSVVDNLKKHDLWLSYIENDCKNQEVFLAVRNNQLDFYHKGGRLFTFDGSNFKTHKKYASAISSTDKEYLTEKEMSASKFELNFKTNYAQIKEYCYKYSKLEALGVSEIYQTYSYLSDNNVVILDIEISFESIDDNNKHDRIDVLLYNKATKTLQFVEAKHYSNSEIWSTTAPKVLGQLKRYENQIKNKKEEILRAYNEYINIINEIFKLNIPAPENLSEDVILLIFGFDIDQKKGRLRELIFDNSEYQGKRVYALGNIKQVVIDNLWKVKAL